MGWFRTFGKTFSIIQFVLIVVLMLLVAVRMLANKPLPIYSFIGTLVNSWAIMLVRQILPWLWSFFCILAIELMIKWNHIDGVNNISTVGQVIPFFVGFGSLVTVFTGWDYKAWKATGARNDEFAQVVVLLLIAALVLGVVVGVLAAVGKVLQP